MSRYSAAGRIGRKITRDIGKDVKHSMNLSKIQKEAEFRPESVQVEGPNGTFWLSPIEFQLYEEMRRKGLLPSLQYCVEGYFVDFAFPDVRVAVEADGAEFHGEQQRDHDKKRDFHLRRAGWKVMHFRGSTIYQKSENCAYVIKKEVDECRNKAKEIEMQKKLDREKQKEALLRPFRKIADLFKREKKE